MKSGLEYVDRQTAFNKISRKHVDFTLCKPENLYPVLLIELDDKSHEKEKVKQRDVFLETVLEKTGYKLLRVSGPNNLEEEITKLVQTQEEDNNKQSDQ